MTEQKQVSAQNEALVEEAVKVVGPVELPVEIVEEAPIISPIEVDFEPLLEKNPDVAAWVYCEGTSIHYPVARGADNDQYLRRLLDGSYNRAGTIFMDYRCQKDCSGWNTIIYGHNMKDDTMFASLPAYADPAWYEAHPVWWLLTPEKSFRVDLIAGFDTTADAALYTPAENRQQRDRVVDLARRLSDFESPVEVGEDDRLVTFSTCLYDTADARYVLVGVLREAE